MNPTDKDILDWLNLHHSVEFWLDLSGEKDIREFAKSHMLASGWQPTTPPQESDALKPGLAKAFEICDAKANSISRKEWKASQYKEGFVDGCDSCATEIQRAMGQDTPPVNQEFNCLPACPTCRRIHPKGECEADKPQEVCAEGNRLCQLEENCCLADGPEELVCTLPKGHSGNHIACARLMDRHNIATWPQQL